MKKYLLSIICTLLPIFAWGADGDVLTAAVDGIEWTYKVLSESEKTCQVGKGSNAAIPVSTQGSVVVPEELGGYKVTVIGFEAFYQCNSITRIVIPNTVTLIEQNAFLQCNQLIEVVFPESSQFEFGTHPFQHCSSLQEIRIPAGLLRLVGSPAIGCESLREYIVDGNNPYFKSLDGIMYSKDNTTLIGYPNARADHYDIPEGVTTIANDAFNGCTSVENVTFPSSLNTIESSVFESSGITSIDIPSSLTAVPYHFAAYCSNLAHVTIPESITMIDEQAFIGTALEEVTIPASINSIKWYAFERINFKRVFSEIANPTPIDIEAFSSEAYSNAKLIVPDGTKALYESVEGWNQFQNIIEVSSWGGDEEAQYWMELESTLQYADDLYGRARDNSNVEQWMLEELSEFMNRGSDMLDAHEADEQEVRHMIEEINYICWEIEEAMNRQPEPSEGPQPYAIFIDNNTALEFRYDDQWSAYREAMMIYPFSSTVDRGWNDMAESIHSVVFNESFANCTTITSTEYWFFGCSNLETFIGLENLNTSNVTNMASMFHGCSSLTSLDLSSFNTTSVTEMKMMFYECPNLTTIYVSSGWSTANVSSSDYMFGGSERIVGGRGTQWNPDYTDAAYAHVDGGENNPGYLTDPNAEPVESEAWFDGLTAWVYGDATLDDAFAEVGRESAAQTIAAIVWEGTGALTAEQMQGITNPNLLVYVNEASKAPAGVQNVIVNGTAAQIVLTDASGNNNFFCPEPFTAQSISYTRNFSQTTEIGVSRGWETIALPFNVQSISHGSHGALVPFGGGNGGYPFWLHQLLSNGLTPVTAMEANTPYLICMPNNTVYPSAYNQAGSVTFASSNITVPRTEPREAFGADVILMPAFQNLSAGSDIFTLNVGAARDSYAEGSVFISNYSNVRPFQCYARHSSQARGTDEIQYIPLTSIGGGDDTTAIMEIIQPAANGTGDWYSLDGRKLSAKPTQKGVYIQNGRKVVIK